VKYTGRVKRFFIDDYIEGYYQCQYIGEVGMITNVINSTRNKLKEANVVADTILIEKIEKIS
jgi:hypothetical protein